jgi:putative endonuclease
MKWIIYILECSDNSLYTGITNDLERRLEEHRAGRGAKYTKHRSPLLVRYTEHRGSKSAALTREAAIKSLARSEKLALIAAQPNTPSSPVTHRGTTEQKTSPRAEEAEVRTEPLPHARFVRVAHPVRPASQIARCRVPACPLQPEW